ncbi:hypothetical protein [Methylobacterium sp. WSM2598]|uniref:hypothetical protein n=1 Tax=Methylobacterium sp. WSM2598 TaxID=398261 RepID=UPI0012F698B9|nr:hypothetical protein [Methylobacterium sp. WSM2598]
MDPISLSTITSAVAVLATECLKEGGTEIGKDVWRKIKATIGWDNDPNPSDLAPQLASKMQNDPELASRIVDLLKKQDNRTSASYRLIEKVDAKNVIVVSEYTSGVINMS